jgi:hypothetical protein
MTKVEVQTDSVIDWPCDSVASFAADPDNGPHWNVNVKSVDWQTSRPAVLGAQIAFVAQSRRRRLEKTYEIVELIPGGHLVMRTGEGPLPMKMSDRWETFLIQHHV